MPALLACVLLTFFPCFCVNGPPPHRSKNAEQIPLLDPVNSPASPRESSQLPPSAVQVPFPAPARCRPRAAALCPQPCNVDLPGCRVDTGLSPNYEHEVDWTLDVVGQLERGHDGSVKLISR